MLTTLSTYSPPSDPDWQPPPSLTFWVLSTDSICGRDRGLRASTPHPPAESARRTTSCLFRIRQQVRAFRRAPRMRLISRYDADNRLPSPRLPDYVGVARSVLTKGRRVGLKQEA